MVTNVLGRGQLSWTVAENRTWRLKGTTGFHSQFAPSGAPSASRRVFYDAVEWVSNATKRRLCLWITKRCLGRRNPKI